MDSKSVEYCILGAGPAGFGAVTELHKRGKNNILLIDRNRIVGGLARTETLGGARFDVGPHRFFTKNREVRELWQQTLKSDFRPTRRLTRIYYKSRYFNYPLRLWDTLKNLGFVESLQVLASFAVASWSKGPSPNTFEDWICQKFGRKLYETFFKSYTEKVWGIPCKEIEAEWAAQRIKGLDFTRVLKHALSSVRLGSEPVRTLADQFDYPVLGAGQMYERMAEMLSESGGRLLLNTKVASIRHQDGRIKEIVILRGDDTKQTIQAEHFFSSIPITIFFKLLDPPPDPGVLAAASALYYREHITVDLLLEGENYFREQWIYVHSPDIRMARVSNYNNFSRAMAGGKNRTALSVEYFTFQHEPLWKMTDEELKDLAIEELEYSGWIQKERILQSWVIRETESYPTYYLGFREPYEILKRSLGQFQNLQPIGRGGLYKYNNQDHSTYSGMLAVRNILKLPGSPYVLWNINVDAEYQELGEKEL